ncbi:RimK family alpha-L-glutamate ligase [Sporolactobacillus shoreicorticis]|uniref:RimK family alpha-L-glutamate ligase n=1 Tax=Sporolactobacillus shoreicorticis TaxID=1923877 RepID=A0ABW5S654_9BACL|nr:RimK family alpha-L-glutamate ligase [Sporolactobacillus shoreicorticis]MCO7127543.1 RimK family alpha-L-glutamate ligase [Sporolactobacillus shoreicorticis]
MKNGWMIYSKSVIHNRYGNNAFEWMTETAARHHIRLVIIFVEDLVIHSASTVTFYNKNEPLRLPDFVFMRCYNRIVGSQLEQLGIRVINPISAMFQSRNKVITSQILAQAGIPTPKTVYTVTNDYPLISGHFNNQPFILKAVEGSQGKNVFLVKNEQDFTEAFNKTKGYCLCQEYMESSYGKDLRVYVLGGRVLGSVLRKSKSGFRANYSLGGSAELYETSQVIESLSVKAAEALNLEFCGIDLLFGNNGFTVCEVNGNAGFRTISKVSDVDIAEELFTYVDHAVYGQGTGDWR